MTAKRKFGEKSEKAKGDAHKNFLNAMDAAGLPRYNHDNRRVHLGVDDRDPNALQYANIKVAVGDLSPDKAIAVYNAVKEAVEKVA